MSKILITGTGRAGTSFLVHLLSALGMDTGYTEEECANELKNACRGGCEHTIEKPYTILKNPEFSLDIENIVQEHEIEHVIIPIRKLEDVGESRKNNAENHGGYGGYWNDCTTKEEQMAKDAVMIYNLIECLERNSISYTLISFPRMVEHWKYLYFKICDIFEELDATSLSNAFNRIADTNKITI